MAANAGMGTLGYEPRALRMRLPRPLQRYTSLDGQGGAPLAYQ